MWRKDILINVEVKGVPFCLLHKSHWVSLVSLVFPFLLLLLNSGYLVANQKEKRGSFIVEPTGLN